MSKGDEENEKHIVLECQRSLTSQQMWKLKVHSDRMFYQSDELKSRGQKYTVLAMLREN